MRLFVALNFPDELRSRWVDQAVALRTAAPRVRWVDASRLHLTIAFLGEQPQGVLARLEPALDQVATRVTTLALEVQGVGVFPGWRGPRVVWLRVAPGAALMALAAAVAASCRELSLPTEERAFHPHVTLGRVDGRLSAAERDALERAAAGVTERTLVEVHSVDLMASAVRARAAGYDVVHRAAFR